MVTRELNKFLEILNRKKSVAFVGFGYFEGSEFVSNSYLIGNGMLLNEQLTFEEIMKKRAFIGLIRRSQYDVSRSKITYKRLFKVPGYEKVQKYFINNSVSIPELIEVDDLLRLTQNWSYLFLKSFLKEKVRLNLGIDDRVSLDLYKKAQGKMKSRFKLIN